MVKKNLGRQKVEMVKMTNESHLLVTFSKRRAGLFKKASEISTLCAAEVVILVLSPGKKVYSFGHPSVDAVIDRYLGCERPDTSGTSQIVEAHRVANISELHMHLDQLTSQLDDEKKRGEELKEMNKANQEQDWRMGPIEELDRSQLLQLRSAMEKLKKDVEAEIVAILDATPWQFYVGSSSSQGYTVPSMIAPPPGYTPNPAQGYGIDPAEEYIVIPAEGNNINPADGDNVNPQGNDILDTPEFGGTYTIDPQENDILFTSGFGGNNANPRGNDDLDPLEKVLKDFEDGFF